MMADYRVPVLETFEFQPSVSGQLADPPGTPTRGDRYLIISPATGDWLNLETQIAYCTNATGPVWAFTIPKEGFICWIDNENEFYSFDGAAWSLYIGAVGPTGPTGPTGPEGAT